MPLPQRRQGNAHHLQPVQQVLPEGSRRHPRIQVPVGGRHQPHIHLEALPPAHSHDLAVFQHPQQFHLHWRGGIADFVQEQRAALRPLKSTGMAGHRSRKRPLFVPEQFTFQKTFREGRAIHRHKRPLRTRPVRMQCPGNQLFSCPAFAADQNGGVRFGQGQRLTNHFEHGGRFGHPRLRRPLAADFVAQLLHLAPQVRRFQRPFQLSLQVIQIQRLLQIVVGAFLHRPHAGVDRSIGRHQDHRRPAFVRCANLFHHFNAVDVGQHEIRQHHIRPFRAERIHARRARGHPFGLISQIANGLHQGAPMVGIIFHNQNPLLAHFGSFSDIGNSMRRRAPLPPESATARLPPFFSMAVRARNNPSPVPCGRVV